MGTGSPEGEGKTSGEERLSPGMRQYRQIKERYPDAILFYHIGDFYETFGGDAELISRELDLVLTSRSKGNDERIPLAGVPYHAADGYISRLVAKGYKVAICDQIEDARKAKGLVKRDVVRVITPGTVIDSTMLPTPDARYLMSICPSQGKEDWGASFLDISTGEFFVTGLSPENPLQSVASEIARYRPAECIVPANTPDEIVTGIRTLGVCVNRFRPDAYRPQEGEAILIRHLNVPDLTGCGCSGMPFSISAASGALLYAKELQNSELTHVRTLTTRPSARYMIVDAVTLRNLEVAESIRPNQKGTTLLSCLNETRTPMGGRLLRSRIIHPILDPELVGHRLDAVEFLVTRPALRLTLRSFLYKFADLERIAGRIAFGNAGPRDLNALADSLEILPRIRNALREPHGPLPLPLNNASDHLNELPDVISFIRRAIIEDPPALPRNGGVIRTGYSKDLDDLRGILRGGKDWIADLQHREREKTGIKSLKVGYNRVFGYYIDVSRPNLHLVPEEYQRKQTTATGERFTVPELRAQETLINNADERVVELERDLYEGILKELRDAVDAVQEIGKGIAEVDVFCSLAEAAQKGGYIRPIVDEKERIIIRDGRHPVVERGIPAGFVPNDTDLSGDKTRIMIITGANMAGKSTYMRAVALICIMAQAGSFVPASHAAIGVVDRIFTRVGAFDDLASGQSTFMVEMLELANILNNVTSRSLVILDEIGRGTSTADGYAIARSVLENLHGKSTQGGVKTLFATHFHDLIEIESELKHVKNYHFAVKETTQEVIFLRRLIPGATDRSYGIHVARLAGIPKKVTDRADTILAGALGGTKGSGRKVQRYTQLLLADDTPLATAEPDPVIEELRQLEPEALTPIQALVKLHEITAKLKRGG